MLERFGTHLWGFPPRLMAPLVIHLGPLRALGWFVWNMPQYQSTLKVFGPIRTHLLCTAISLVNGCRYCGYGHTYALQLAYLRDHGRLFPLDEHTIEPLRGVPPGAIRHHLVNAAQHAELHGETRWLQRAITLTTAPDPRPTDHDDLRIAHLVRMFAVLNEVGIANHTPPDQAHTPLNKDHALKTRYAALRAASDTPPHPGTPTPPGSCSGPVQPRR